MPALSPPAAALAEMHRIEAAHDRLTPELYQRLRDLAASRVPPAPEPSTTELVSELARLREISRERWAKLKRCVFALRQARAAYLAHRAPENQRRKRALTRDAEWQMDTFAEVRRRIAEVEAQLSNKSAAE